MSDYTELATIRDLVRFAATQFNEAGLYFGHGTDNAWDDACALIFHTLHLPHALFANAIDARVTGQERSLILNLINQRITQRIPVPYLTKEAWFSGLSFYVDERVLIPRSPIAELIEKQFAPWIDPEKVTRILDLCTGSGCIAIACAHAFPDAIVDASDISSDAITVAKINLLRHNVEDQVHLIQSDLFDSLPAAQYDIIVSNPPYVSQEEMDALPAEYHHEPKTGLTAGADGLDFVRRILRVAPAYLAPHGILIVEVGNSEFNLAEAYPDMPFTWLEFEHGGGGVFMLTKEQMAV